MLANNCKFDYKVYQNLYNIFILLHCKISYSQTNYVIIKTKKGLLWQKNTHLISVQR